MVQCSRNKRKDDNATGCLAIYSALLLVFSANSKSIRGKVEIVWLVHEFIVFFVTSGAHYWSGSNITSPPKARIVKSEGTSIAGQRIGKHVHAETYSWYKIVAGLRKHIPVETVTYENERRFMCVRLVAKPCIENVRGFNLAVGEVYYHSRF
jgi:hypothetical protein